MSQVGGVVVREGDGAARHRERLFEFTPFEREEIGVVVEYHGVIRIVAQAVVVGFVALLHIRPERTFSDSPGEIVVDVLFAGGGFLVPGVADKSPDHAAQRICPA